MNFSVDFHLEEGPEKKSGLGQLWGPLRPSLMVLWRASSDGKLKEFKL
jgi:hypothetical protein